MKIERSMSGTSTVSDHVDGVDLSAADPVAFLTIGVVRLAGGWTIVTGGRRWGRFDHRVDAEEAGLRLAADALARGGSVRVLVQTAFGEMEELDARQARAVA